MRLPKILTTLFLLTPYLWLAGCGLKLPPKPADGAPSEYPGKYPRPE